MPFAVFFLCAISLVAALSGPVYAEAGAGKAYPDGHGGEVFFPLGDVSFADDVSAFEAGDPDGGDTYSRPGQALGVPDHADGETRFVTLGCAGELVLSFSDNALIDVAGADLYVFEIGPDVEATGLAISDDGETWTRVGMISGGKAEIDIARYVSGDASYRFIKLVDLKQACDSRTPGADIDAVGAIGSAAKITLDSAVLFDTAEYTLKPGAYESIDAVLGRIDDPQSTRVTVAGHTDNVGTQADNEVLSRNRAETVAAYLMEHGGFAPGAVTTRAYGESRPVASNETAEGRSRNRRVELTLRITPAGDDAGQKPVEILGIWETRGHGILEMQRAGDAIRATYTSDGGALIGELVSDTVFEGFWIEDNSNRTCDSTKDGREHWGPIRLEFETAARDRFTGSWGYCGDPPDNQTWGGERLL